MFSVGDRVCFLCDHPDGKNQIKAGDLGIVCCCSKTGSFGIRCDEYVDGHDCCGHCESGYGWFVGGEDIGLFEDEVEFEIDSQEFMALITNMATE